VVTIVERKPLGAVSGQRKLLTLSTLPGVVLWEEPTLPTGLPQNLGGGRFLDVTQLQCDQLVFCCAHSLKNCLFRWRESPPPHSTTCDFTIRGSSHEVVWGSSERSV
jgi:hypothetical protein